MDPRAQYEYNALFPYYVELCTVTQYHQKGERPGGWGGHAVMFIGGAERVPHAPYPRLRLVDDGPALFDPDTGTGVSVNRNFRNIRWVAIPGRANFYQGGLAADEVLDEATYEAAVARAARTGWFSGIEIESRTGEATGDLSDVVARSSIGTDFGLCLARSVYGVRLPFERDRLALVIAHLNELNEVAHRGRADRWDLIANNCSHVAHNALAAAGVWDAKTPRAPGPTGLAGVLWSLAAAAITRRTSDFAFPANSFVRGYEAGNARPIDDPAAAFADRDLARTIPEGWTSTGPGALVVRYAMREAARDRLFAQGIDPLLFSIPRLWDKRSMFERLTRHPDDRVTDLSANLAWFRARYTDAHEATRARADAAEASPGDAFQAFRRRLEDHLARALVRTDSMVARLDRLRSAGSRPSPAVGTA